jgi:transposase InsO family protein
VHQVAAFEVLELLGSRPPAEDRVAVRMATEAGVFHTLETEWLYHFDFHTREEARLAIFDYIETLYNRRRLHSAIGPPRAAFHHGPEP